jgi:putative transposase
MTLSELKRLKALEAENSRLKRMYAEAFLDRQILKDIVGKKIVRPVERKEVAKKIITRYAVSKRKACYLLNIGRTSFYYKAKQIDEKEIKEKLFYWQKDIRDMDLKKCLEN